VTAPKTIQAKHVDADALLAFVARCHAGEIPWRHVDVREPRWCLTWDLEAAFPDVPPKVLLAKCRALIRQGRLEGCTCGCRGDFNLPGSPWSGAPA
jgi:hypothetical protein